MQDLFNDSLESYSEGCTNLTQGSGKLHFLKSKKHASRENSDQQSLHVVGNYLAFSRFYVKKDAEIPSVFNLC